MEEKFELLKEQIKNKCLEYMKLTPEEKRFYKNEYENEILDLIIEKNKIFKELKGF